MECSCSISAGVDDFAEVISAKWITARKRHSCHECNRLILMGEEYYKEIAEARAGSIEAVVKDYLITEAGTGA